MKNEATCTHAALYPEDGLRLRFRHSDRDAVSSIAVFQPSGIDVALLPERIRELARALDSFAVAFESPGSWVAAHLGIRSVPGAAQPEASNPNPKRRRS